MLERGFLIHSLPTSTEVARLEILLIEYKDILNKINRNNGRVSNGEKIQLEMLRETMQEMFRNEDLKERFYFDISEMVEKVKNLLG